MKSKIKVMIRPGLIRSRRVWLMNFKYDEKLITKIKLNFSAKWCAELKCWWMDYQEVFIEQLKTWEEIALLQSQHLYENKKVILSYKEHVSQVRLKKEKSKGLLIEDAAEKDLALWHKKLIARQYAENTIESYLSAMRIFLNWLSNKNHKEVRKNDIEKYMQYLTGERKVSRSYQNLHINAIKLFYSDIISIHLDVKTIIRPRREYKLPHYLTREEVTNILASLGNLKHKAMISLIYACGLRIGEVTRIKLTDIDPAQRLLIIRQSKGNKDRVVPLPESILYLLDAYAKAYNPICFLFEGQVQGENYSARSLQLVFKGAVKKSGIRNQEASVHWLRHSFATHLLEMGTNLRDLQMLLGHKNLKTTEGYLHISSTQYHRIVSPFDVLPPISEKNNLEHNPKKLYF